MFHNSTIQKNYKLTLNPVHIPFNHKRMDKVPRFSRLWPRSASLRLFLAFFSPPFARKASIFSSYLALAASNFSWRSLENLRHFSATEARMLPGLIPNFHVRVVFGTWHGKSGNSDFNGFEDPSFLFTTSKGKCDIWTFLGSLWPFDAFRPLHHGDSAVQNAVWVQAGCHVCQLRFHMTTIYLYTYAPPGCSYCATLIHTQNAWKRTIKLNMETLKPTWNPARNPTWSPSGFSAWCSSRWTQHENQHGNQHGLFLVRAWPTNIQETQKPFKKGAGSCLVIFGGMICVGSVWGRPNFRHKIFISAV